jgi:hypothetical protein
VTPTQHNPFSHQRIVRGWQALTLCKRILLTVPILASLTMSVMPAFCTDWWLAHDEIGFRVRWAKADVLLTLLSRVALVAFGVRMKYQAECLSQVKD